MDEVETAAPGAKAPSRERVEGWACHHDTSLTGNVDAMPVAHHDPASLPNNLAFGQAVSVAGPVRTISVGGQSAVAADGSVVGAGA